MYHHNINSHMQMRNNTKKNNMKNECVRIIDGRWIKCSVFICLLCTHNKTHFHTSTMENCARCLIRRQIQNNRCCNTDSNTHITIHIKTPNININVSHKNNAQCIIEVSSSAIINAQRARIESPQLLHITRLNHLLAEQTIIIVAHHVSLWAARLNVFIHFHN